MARGPGPKCTQDERSNLAALIDLISERTGYNKTAIKFIIWEFRRAICDELESGKKVISLHGFFKIEVMHRKERRSVSIKTGKFITNPATDYIRLTPQMHLMRAIGFSNQYVRNNQRYIDARLAKKEKVRMAKLATLNPK